MIAVQITTLSLSAVGLAFLAGVVSFVSPCVLPLLPAYLSIISGVGVDELGVRRRKVLTAAVLFVVGFTLVFVLMGAAAGGVGGLLIRHHRELTIAAGAFIAFSGLVVAGVIPMPERALGLLPRAGAGGPFLIGAALAIAWTPCVGYVLGAILSMAATSHSAAAGSLLLLVYSAGLAVPFLLAALAFDWVSAHLTLVKRHYRAIQITAGVVLMVVGVALMFGVFARLNAWLPIYDPGGL